MSKNKAKKAKRTRRPKYQNKKIKNAEALTVDGIQFKSRLEAYCHQKLKEAGICATYEGEKFEVLPAFKFQKESVRAITYTPDFVGIYGNTPFIIETKGFATDSFKLRYKLFKAHLVHRQWEGMLFMPRNQKQIDEMIKIIQDGQ